MGPENLEKVLEKLANVLCLSNCWANTETSLRCNVDLPLEPVVIYKVHFADYRGNSWVSASQILQFVLFRRSKYLADTALF
jgi:hypothetical protein